MKAIGIILAGFIIAILVFLMAALCIQFGFNIALEGVIPTQMTFHQAMGVVLFLMGVKMATFNNNAKRKE
jgi:energy-converting hydrogenase Eha subunit B